MVYECELLRGGGSCSGCNSAVFVGITLIQDSDTHLTPCYVPNRYSKDKELGKKVWEQSKPFRI